MSFFLAVTIPSLALADIYKYVNEDGLIVYTDSPTKNKPSEVIKTGDKKAEPAPAARRDARTEKKAYPKNYASIIHDKAKKYDIDPKLINAIIIAESNYNPYAISKKGACGLMQLMPATAVEMGVSNSFNPEQNIEGGTRYLRYLLERFEGNLTLALAAYNAGPTVVEQYGSIPPIRETKKYVKRVLTHYNENYVYTPAPSPKKLIYKVVLADGTVLYTNANASSTSF